MHEETPDVKFSDEDQPQAMLPTLAEGAKTLDVPGALVHLFVVGFILLMVLMTVRGLLYFGG